jgi:dTDP-glucose 4,6-dehydratase
MKIIVTGGAGFIGANFLNRLVPQLPEHHFVNLDKLTYAANLGSLRAIDSLPNYTLRRVDMDGVDAVFDEFDPDLVVHFAAESHVDRSIVGPREFIRTNIEGTFNLLEACRKRWSGDDNRLFHHVSTDEVYGSLGETGLFKETTPYDPSSPYSASRPRATTSFAYTTVRTGFR